MAQILPDAGGNNGEARITVKNGRMLIDLPLSKDPPLSSTGKTRLAYSTHGSLTYGEYKVLINVMLQA